MTFRSNFQVLASTLAVLLLSSLPATHAEAHGESAGKLQCEDQAQALEGIWRMYQLGAGLPGPFASGFELGRQFSLLRESGDLFQIVAKIRDSNGQEDWVKFHLQGACDQGLYILSAQSETRYPGWGSLQICLHQVTDPTDDWCELEFAGDDEAIVACSTVMQEFMGDQRIAVTSQQSSQPCDPASGNPWARDPGHAHGGGNN